MWWIQWYWKKSWNSARHQTTSKPQPLQASSRATSERVKGPSAVDPKTRDTQREEWEKSDVWKVSVRCAMWAGGCAGLELHGPEWTSPRRASKRPHRGVIHETVSNKQCRKWSKMTCTREDRLLCRRFPASVAVNKCLFLLWICRLEYIDWGHSIL